LGGATPQVLKSTKMKWERRFDRLDE